MSAFQIEIPVKLYGETGPLPEPLLNYAGVEMIEVTSVKDLRRGKRVLLPGRLVAIENPIRVGDRFTTGTKEFIAVDGDDGWIHWKPVRDQLPAVE